ncbi:(p)ppGpp synthase/HD superfamily hydrolase [Phyllobacterium trifolii]|uniref:(P)ppGpp synthase/HD superfamily hydrolase n=1 Tax=Phyllobacterium trifolii TaxID=300193 RepID=A0A839UI88_9HYPH|nr:hypothetical protein [Phyllobacterium trifolii]MBB3149625.1 (p)ppGpp synthase/HD superfamily hydrolase [Phyllobacterium trifolii]
MTSLEHAISIAASAHAGYLADDKEPYIFHLLRVMLALDTEDERIVGVQHDVVEKTALTLDSLRSEGFPGHILERFANKAMRRSKNRLPRS